VAAPDGDTDGVDDELGSCNEVKILPCVIPLAKLLRTDTNERIVGLTDRDDRMF
jgi:hypothetical protein